jgi:thioredoxin 1
MGYQELEKILTESNAVLTYFSSDGCGVCGVLKPQVENLIQNKYPEIDFIEIDAKAEREICGQLNVHSIPTVIIFFEGKEFYRFARNFSQSEIDQAIERPYEMFFDKKSCKYD